MDKKLEDKEKQFRQECSLIANGEDLPKETQYKPPLGKKVYCIYYDESILVQEVGYLGKESFIVAEFDECYNFDSFEWHYEDYNKTWFTSLLAAKKKLLEVAYKQPNEELKVVKVSDIYYEVKNKYER